MRATSRDRLRARAGPRPARCSDGDDDVKPGADLARELRRIARGADAVALAELALDRSSGACRRARATRRRRTALRHQHRLRPARADAHRRRPARAAAEQPRAARTASAPARCSPTDRAPDPGCSRWRASRAATPACAPVVIDALARAAQRRRASRSSPRRARSAPRATSRRSRTSRCALIGVGEVRVEGKRSCRAAGAEARRPRSRSSSRRRKAWRCSTARRSRRRSRCTACSRPEDVFAAAVVAGALSVDAAQGSDTPFDARIHAVRGQPGQRRGGRPLTAPGWQGSADPPSHLDGDQVQDPYCLRCQPQVMGACLDRSRTSARILLTRGERRHRQPARLRRHRRVLSGGNFHAEPVAFAADNLALAIAEIGALSERRIALLIDPRCRACRRSWSSTAGSTRAS